MSRGLLLQSECSGYDICRPQDAKARTRDNCPRPLHAVSVASRGNAPCLPARLYRPDLPPPSNDWRGQNYSYSTFTLRRPVHDLGATYGGLPLWLHYVLCVLDCHVPLFCSSRPRPQGGEYARAQAVGLCARESARAEWLRAMYVGLR